MLDGMRILVTAASRHGATAQIATAVADHLAAAGHAVRTGPIGEAAVGDAEACVLGSAVYYGHWLPEATDFVTANAAVLVALPVWLFSSGPLGEGEDRLPLDDTIDVTEVAAAVDPADHRVFAGRLDRSALKFHERAMVAALRAPEGDFRDWAAIGAWAAEIDVALRAGV